jgi:hypothetical protein
VAHSEHPPAIHDAPIARRDRQHPHNYEVLSGQPRMPALPDVAEKEALEGKMNSG